MQTQPIYHDTTAMPNTPDLDVICPLTASTPDSAEYHLDVANAERARNCPDLPPQRPVREPIPFSTLPMARRLDLQEAIDELVEAYGFGEVWRSLRLIAAVNGREL
jgi:hypothetical protein